MGVKQISSDLDHGNSTRTVNKDFTLTLISFNISGLLNKLNSPTFFNNLLNFDIFCFYETWLLAQDIKYVEHFFCDFNLHWIYATKENVKGHNKHGILLGFKKKFSEYIKFKNINNFTCIEVRNVNQIITIIPVYFPHANWNAYLSNISNILNFINTEIILIGDFNCRLSNLHTHNTNYFLSNLQSKFLIRKSLDTFADFKGKKLLELCNNYNLGILNGVLNANNSQQFTFHGLNSNTTIDYAFVTDLYFIKNFYICDEIDSDHQSLKLEINFTSNALINQDNLHKKFKPLKVPNVENYVENYQLRTNEQFELLGTANNQYEQITDYIIQKSNLNIQAAKFKYKKPWFDRECFKFRSKLFQTFKILKKNPNQENSKNYAIIKKKYYQLINLKKKQHVEKILTSFQNIKNNIEFWKAVDQLNTKSKFTIASIPASNWVTHFKKLLNNSTFTFSLQFFGPLNSINYLDELISLDEIYNALNDLKNNKAAGPDLIPIEFYKYAGKGLMNNLHIFFNYILLHLDVPKQFKQSALIPLFKNGDKSVVSNYRGICIQNAMYKIFTVILLNRLEKYVYSNNLLLESQAGFRKSYSTIDNLSTLDSLIELAFYRKKPLYCCFIDYKAAFDSICWDALFFKLKQIGLSYKFITLIQLLYEKSTIHIKTKEGLTDDFETTAGVQQGNNLSPILFSLFINDMDTALEGNGVKIKDNFFIKLLKFADDVKLVSSDFKDLQIMLNNLHNYNNQWGLNLNLDKTKIVIFSQTKLKHVPKWTYDNKPIEIVSSYKYLGIEIDNKYSLKNHYKNKLNQAKSALSQIYAKVLDAKIASFEPKLRVYESVSRNILTYGAQIYGYKQNNEIEKNLRYFIKRTFYLPITTPNYCILGETGLPPVYNYSLQLHFSYIEKVLKFMPDYRYPKKLKLYLIENNIGWGKWIKAQLIKYNLCAQNVQLTPEIILSNLKKLYTCLTNEWKSDYEHKIIMSQEHSLYKHLINNFEQPKSYLSQCNLWETRLIFAARTQMLKLNAMPYSNSTTLKCQLCNLNANEDIIHILGQCTFYTQIRKECLNSNSFSFEECIQILQGQLQPWKNLAKFIQQFLKLRKISLF